MKKKAWLFSVFLGSLVLIAPCLAWAVDLKEGVEQLATQLAKSVPAGRQLRVAVTDFPDLQEVVSDLGRYIAERLTTRLSQDPRLWVIERRRLSQVLGELRFGMSDLVDPAKAKQLGKMVGVEAIVVGSISDLVNQVDVDVRMIEIEAGKTLPGVTVSISKDQVVTELLARGRAVATAPSLRSPGVPPQVSSPSAPLPKPVRIPISRTKQQIQVEMIGIERITDETFLLRFKIQNLGKGEDATIARVSLRETYIVARGQRYDLKKSTAERFELFPESWIELGLTFPTPPGFEQIDFFSLVSKMYTEGHSGIGKHYEITIPGIRPMAAPTRASKP